MEHQKQALNSSMSDFFSKKEKPQKMDKKSRQLPKSVLKSEIEAIYFWRFNQTYPRQKDEFFLTIHRDEPLSECLELFKTPYQHCVLVCDRERELLGLLGIVRNIYLIRKSYERQR